MPNILNTISSALSKGSTYLRQIKAEYNAIGNSRSFGGSLAGTKAPGGRYMFPPDIDRFPCLQIQVKKSPALEVFLQVPQGVAIGDIFSYGSMNLGQIGKIAQDTLSSAENIKSFGDATKLVNDVGTKLKDEYGKMQGGTLKTAAVFQVLNKAGMVPNALGAGTAAESVMYNKRAVLNPNQVSTFAGSNVRTFAFNFKLVASSAKESQDIKDLVLAIRTHAYPGGSDIVLDYPSEFHINFLTKDRQVNPYIPQIFPCYLMNVTTTYNSTANSFYEDGAPLEVDIALSFQETKALTRNDINAREKGRQQKNADRNELYG